MKKIPFLYTLIRGAIGKQFVIKHYGKHIVKTKFPDMTNIIPSKRQRACRQLFAEAVSYAQAINNDAEKKRAYKAKIKKSKTVYLAAIREYLLMRKEAATASTATGIKPLRMPGPVQKMAAVLRVLPLPVLPVVFIWEGNYLRYNDTG